MVDLLRVLDLLGGHVLRRAHHLAGGGQVSGQWQWLVASARPLRLRGH